ncbi:MAG: hypothetical protein CRN43_06840 [Candidatus Nephrothrix sp. EaCA]|nr:MAG: hypothetical protein CRN43_06840 [Candidatus Nephrothrix sp. EaCA]
MYFSAPFHALIAKRKSAMSKSEAKKNKNSYSQSFTRLYNPILQCVLKISHACSLLFSKSF